MHIADFSSGSTADVVANNDRGETERGDVDDQFTRRRCAPCSVRQVALGAIVASHLHNEAQRSSLDDDVSANNFHTEHRPVYL